jgi:exosortase/archaeosortase
MQYFNTVLTLFIIVMCLVFAYFMTFTDLKRESLDGTPRTIFVFIMLGYGAFRGYRMYKTFKEQRNENPE